MKTGDKIKATTESARTTKKKQKGDHRIKIENITKYLKKLCTKTTKKSRMEITTWRLDTREIIKKETDRNNKQKHWT